MLTKEADIMELKDFLNSPEGKEALKKQRIKSNRAFLARCVFLAGVNEAKTKEDIDAAVSRASKILGIE